jgi:prepilin-type N-terminal cleavage/methylation domain-containing protein/prepilin-type processing-associated H-X9-DG protein
MWNIVSQAWRFHMCRPSARGFTLIEILVVVAIIALLVAVLLPSLAAARDQAQTVVCKTRMREMYNGHLFYAQDHKQHFPHMNWWLWDVPPTNVNGFSYAENQLRFWPNLYKKTGGIRPTDSKAWLEFGHIYKYVKNKDTYLCPKDALRRIAGAIGGGGGCGEQPISSYTRFFEPQYLALWHATGNSGAAPDDGILEPSDFLRIEDIRPKTLGTEAGALVHLTCTTSPDRVALMFEEWPNGEGTETYDPTAHPNANVALNDGYSGPIVAASSDFFAMRHRKKGHLLYWDGHIALGDYRINRYPADREAAVMTLGATRQ